MRRTEETCDSTVLAEMLRSRRHLLVGVAAGDQAQDLALTGRQLVELGVEARRRCTALGEGVEHEAGQARREHRVPGGDPVDGLEELGARDRLGDVAAGAGPDDVDHVLGGVGDRQGEELHLGMMGQHAAQDGVPAAAGEVHVEQDHVGQALADELDGGRRLVGLAHHLDRVAQLGPDAGPEHGVVLDQEDAGPPAAGRPGPLASVT